MSKGEYPFLKVGYCSFPLKDVGRKFKVIDTLDIEIKKPKFTDFKNMGKCKYMLLHINYREIEKSLWEEIRKKHKELIKQADWLVISMISEFGDKLSVSVDMLKKV